MTIHQKKRRRQRRMLLLVGPIASGKSTRVRELAVNNYVVANDDALVLAVHGGDYKLYDEALKPLYKGVEMQIISTAVSLNRDVVIDRTNLTRAARARYISYGRSLDIPVYAEVFPMESPVAHALRRFQADSRGHDFDYWLRVAEFHESTYQPPSLDEGFEDIFPTVTERE